MHAGSRAICNWVHLGELNSEASAPFVLLHSQHALACLLGALHLLPLGTSLSFLSLGCCSCSHSCSLLRSLGHILNYMPPMRTGSLIMCPFHHSRSRTKDDGSIAQMFGLEKVDEGDDEGVC